MRRIAAALLVGLVLGITSTAAAGVSIYWQRGGNDYVCEGVATGVICKSGGYSVGITRSFVYVQKLSGRKSTFGCRKWSSWASCVSG